MAEGNAFATEVNAARRAIAHRSRHYLTNRVKFMLDATLGMMTVEQNHIIKMFSVTTVMLMPPTLIASVYGMNFKHMPELGWA